MPPAIVDELLEQFLIEGRELVQQASDDLLGLSADADEAGLARLDGAFRAIHTLKGSVGLFDLAPMGLLLHAAEDVLSASRAARRLPDRAAVTALLDCVSLCDEWIGAFGGQAKLPESAERDSRRMIARLHEAPGGPDAAAPPAAAEPAPTAAASTAERSGGRPLRVDAAHVDALLDRVGELTVAKNALAELARRGATDPVLRRSLAASHAEIARLVDAVHQAVMRVRMTPLRRTLGRLPRLAREIADRLGKDVTLDISGDAMEADKTIVDALFEPLLHVVRNAVDHGIEPAALRVARGKPAAGRIGLAVRREADRIVVELGDDGGGVDCDKVRAAAAARGLLPEATLRRMDDAAIRDLIFSPGLSTAPVISEVSGRGVGMDAVRNAVEALGGRVVLTSVPGQGSVVSMSLPQSVLIKRVMVVRAGADRFGVPIEEVGETVRLSAAQVQPIRDGEAFVLRGRTVPLLRLTRLLDLDDEAVGGDRRVLVVACGEQTVGVEVGGFADPIDVVLRPLPGLLAAMRGVVGTALLGDGRVLMVLDLPGLIG